MSKIESTNPTSISYNDNADHNNSHKVSPQTMTIKVSRHYKQKLLVSMAIMNTCFACGIHFFYIL